MPSTFKIDDLKVDKSEIKMGYLKLMEYGPGLTLEIPITIVNGVESGPVLWIQGAIHGDEYDGALGILKLTEILRPEKLTGTIIAVPVLNIPAFTERNRTNTIDYKDLNRCFPGKSEGTFTEVMAENLLNLIIERVDYLIDIHSGGRDFIVAYWSIYHRTGGKVENEARMMAEAMLAPAPSDPPKFIWGHGSGILDGTLFVNTSREGVPSIIFEGRGGGQARYSEKGESDASVSTIIEGIKNVLRALNMIPEKVIEDDNYHEIGDLKFLTSPYGGLFESLVSLGERVRKDQVIARVRNLHNEVREIESPEDGVIMAIRTFPTVRVSDWIFELGTF